MSASSLRQIGQPSNGQMPCHYDGDKMDDLLSAITSVTNNQAALTKDINVLSTYYKEMTRWLLIVVCVIALGKELLSILRDVTHARAETVQNR